MGKRSGSESRGVREGEEREPAAGADEAIRLTVEAPTEEEAAGAAPEERGKASWRQRLPFGAHSDDPPPFPDAEGPRLRLDEDALRNGFRLISPWLARLMLFAKKPQTIEQAQIIAAVWQFNDQETTTLSAVWTDVINKSNLTRFQIKLIKEGTLWGGAIGVTADIMKAKGEQEIALSQSAAAQGQATSVAGLPRYPRPDPDVPPVASYGD